MAHLLPYLVARNVASRLDAQGDMPGPLLKSVVMVPLAIIAVGVAYLVLRVLAAVVFGIP